MTTVGKQLTTTDIPSKGDMIITGGRTFIAKANAEWVDVSTAEMMMLDDDDESSHWIKFSVPTEDCWQNPDEIVFFDRMLMCECHMPGKTLVVFWDGQPSVEIDEKNNGWKEINPENAWTTFSG